MKINVKRKMLRAQCTAHIQKHDMCIMCASTGRGARHRLHTKNTQLLQSDCEMINDVITRKIMFSLPLFDYLMLISVYAYENYMLILMCVAYEETVR